ncbi:chromosome partitioning protein ParB (plasmid) [Acuticoccus sp. MNP-M23]|uniref:chromosome partitioning protein ParB n=1 Tax=Acuticoccus sp. MNP-M23 TaxID=3072793 RepID=UPI002814CA8F|nr:chromosome partitioning protein ParB [Acuticoccus sp. MNP-M23]WMS45253.1 chromosome partitioning protein ParB [Acuticoccus sp. MNP-M23]
MSEKAFSIDLGQLKSRAKPADKATLGQADEAGERHGFIAREPGRRGRRPSPRTGQVHAKVLPHIADAIADEARRRGVTQGVILEEAFALYVARGVHKPDLSG